MKKISIFTAFLLMLSLSSIAQQDSLSQTNKCQYYYAIEVNGKLGIDLDVPWGVGIAEIHGIQFNPHLIVGLGLGFDYYDTYYAGGDMDFFMFSTFVNLRYLILKDSKWTPMLSFSLGYLGAYERYQSERYKHRGTWEHGFMAELFVGANYRIKASKSLYMGIGLDVPQMAFALKVGFQL